MDMPMRAPRQPCLDLRGFVCGIVVHHQMHIRTFRHVGVDLFEKVEKFFGAMAFVAFSDHGTCSDIQGRKQRSRTMADIGMGPPLGHAWQHRQNRLLTIQRLDLRLFIHT